MSVFSYIANIYRNTTHMSLASAVRWQNYMRRRDRQYLLVNQTSPVSANFVLRTQGSDIATYKEVMRLEVYRSVCDYVRAPETIVDCGANIGLASLYFARRYPAARMFAIEPNQESYRELQRNIQLSNLEHRLTAILGAVWVRHATMATHFSGADDRFSACRVREASVSERTVPGFTMKDIVGMMPRRRISLLKIDVEGAEADLFGLDQDISWLASVQTMAIEFHDNARAATEFDSRIISLGFNIIDEKRGHTVIATRGSLHEGSGCL
jgi:FkbM family methyltransferase